MSPHTMPQKSSKFLAKNRSILITFTLLLIAGLSVGCTTTKTRLALPTQFEKQASLMPVVQPKDLFSEEKMEFGPYKVNEVRRTWIDNHKNNNPKLKFSRSKQRYKFQVSNYQGRRWFVKCDNKSRRKVQAVKVKAKAKTPLAKHLTQKVKAEKVTSRLFCRMWTADGDSYWKMLVYANGPKKALQGEIWSDEIRVNVFGRHKASSATKLKKNPTGYHFRLGREMIGAVDIMNGGAVWMKKRLKPEQRQLVAAASSALLLYKELRSTL